MLQSRSQRQNLNQENPSQKNQQQQQQFPTKTPSRQTSSSLNQAGPSKGLLTGGKGLTSTVGRSTGVLAVKDANKGRGTESIRLFTEKPSVGSTSASCAPSFLSPLPAPRATLPLHLLRTPAPSLVKPIHFLSPDEAIDDDIEEEEEESGMEMDLEVDREVEYAGASPANRDEPFEAEFPDSEFNFKNAGYGKILRAIPILPTENYEEWAVQDLEEVKATRFELDIEDYDESVKHKYDDSSKPIFPAPKRLPLASKSTNVSRPISSASLHNRTFTFNTTKPSLPLRTALSSSHAATSSTSSPFTKPRTPLGSVTTPRAKWGAGSGPSPNITRGGLKSPATPIGSSRLASASSTTTSRLLPKKPLNSSTSSSVRLVKTSATAATSSFSSLATLEEDLVSATKKKLDLSTTPRLTREEEEIALGMFGIVEDSGMDGIFEDESFAEEGFVFDLEG